MSMRRSKKGGDKRTSNNPSTTKADAAGVDAAIKSSKGSSGAIGSLLGLFPTEFPQVETEVLDDESSALTPIVRAAILGLICLLAFAIRLFAVVRWESVIHEFDPYFNYRVTKFLASEGSLDFLNWLDDRAWYPLGRIVGGTVYPGLMATAAIFYWVLNALNLTMNIRNMCVFLAPIFAANAAISSYLFTTEVTRRPSTGLIAAALTSIVPSYISRSVGGSYDNEGVAIFALIFTFYLWVKSVNTGSLFWGACCALSYFYMVAAWGGYVFIINIIPIYVIIMLVAGRYSPRLYVAYTTFYTLGSLLAMQVPFVGFNIVTSAECAGSHGVFILLQVYAFIVWLRMHVRADLLQRLIVLVLGGVVAAVAVAMVSMQLMGKIQWTGRSLSLLDPTYAKKYIPIIASVSEHQPTTWTSFFFDLHICVPLAPVGIYFLFQDITDAKIFAILYGTISWYFAGVMVRLMLTLAPIACILAAVAASEILHKFTSDIEASDDADAAAAIDDIDAGGKKKKSSLAGTAVKAATAKAKAARVPKQLAWLVIGLLSFLFFFYAVHCVYVASEAYSSPSIVLASRGAHGERVIFDDFREAYSWLRMNTDEDAKVMAWWDYGYQMSAMANRTVIVDNNTWNNTHIATVGRAMASTEEKAYPIITSLDVDYVLVIFGGYAGYQSDDINKFLWMVRIGGGVYPNHIQESNYFAGGRYRMDKGGAPQMLNSLMYKLSYYRFGEVKTDYSKPGGFDRTRNIEIGNKDISFEHMEEAFTSEHWLVRIYKVLKPSNRPAGHLQHRSARSKKASSALAADDEAKPAYIGCVSSEAFLSADKIYGGGTTGAHFNLAKHHAVTNNKKYFAVARAGADGHSFSFDTAPKTFDVDSEGCHLGCLDDPQQGCGCADDACYQAGDKPVGGEANNRRWAVYEVSGSAKKSSKKGGKKRRSP